VYLTAHGNAGSAAAVQLLLQHFCPAIWPSTGVDRLEPHSRELRRSALCVDWADGEQARVETVGFWDRDGLQKSGHGSRREVMDVPKPDPYGWSRPEQ
jgi:hypothetical protein